MNYLGFKYLLLLIIFLHCTSGTSSCSFDHKITPRITAIGRPIGPIKVTWRSVNSSGRLVSYKVHYNRTSKYNHCEYPLTDPLYTAKHCSQNSTRGGIDHECDLTKEYKMLKMKEIKDSLCVLISITSASSNETCYSFFREYNSYHTEPICPVPENFHVYSPAAGNLTVNWNVPPKLVGDVALNEMSFIVHYEPVGNSALCMTKETKILSADSNYKFFHQNNGFIIKDLGSCCPYRVTICCAFTTISPVCHPGYVSEPFYVTTAEEVPKKAPQVQRYHIQNESLLVKWKIPSNYVCTDKITAFEIQYWEKQENNCSSTINIGSASIKKYNTTISSDRKAVIAGVSSSVPHCFHIRIRNRLGCGPWSKFYVAEDYTITARKRTSNSSSGLTSKETVAIIIAALAILILLVPVLVIFVKKIRNGPVGQRPLEEEVGDLQPATELLDSSQSTETESLYDYATA